MISLSIQLVVPVDIPVEEEDRFGDGRKRGTTCDCANVYLPKEQPTKTVGRGTLIHLTGFSNGERIEWV